MNALGGTQDSNQDTQPECRDECLRRGDNCAGYDFNRVANQCWIHTSSDNVATSNRRSNNDIDLYVKKPCGRSSVDFLLLYSFHILNFIQVPALARSATRSLLLLNLRKLCKSCHWGGGASPFVTNHPINTLITCAGTCL